MAGLTGLSTCSNFNRDFIGNLFTICSAQDHTAIIVTEYTAIRIFIADPNPRSLRGVQQF